MATRKPRPRGRTLKSLERELDGVCTFLHDLRHNRGRWPKAWVTGMIAHYEVKHHTLRQRVAAKKRTLRKVYRT